MGKEEGLAKMENLENIIAESTKLAEKWQQRADQLLSPDEKIFQKRFQRLLKHLDGKVVLTNIIDQSFRSENTGRVAGRLKSLFQKYGIPYFFLWRERILIRFFLLCSQFVHRVSIPVMINRIIKECGRFILPGEKEALSVVLQEKKQNAVKMNINHIGEAVLGEEEARRHLNWYLEDLKRPEIEYLSVKVSSLYSQTRPFAFEHSVAVIKDRLALLYRTALKNPFIPVSGAERPKIITLDMEGYQDLEITVTAFMQALDDPGLAGCPAGIALQSYLPESFEIQQRLTDWARQRMAKGGIPIKLRIVKGANLEMEKVESEINNRPLAPYDNKLDVDANFKRMLEYGTRPENIRTVNLGIASHNLFELAFAYILSRQREVGEFLVFEMLEGMATHVMNAIKETTGEVLIYAPVAVKAGFINAVAYLIRRLDENTAEENFLRYACNLKTDSPEWSFLKQQFIDSCRGMKNLKTVSNRIQDRRKEDFSAQNGVFGCNEFLNEPDTDWSLSGNREWAGFIRNKWQKFSGDEPLKIPVTVAGKDIFEDRRNVEAIDPSSIRTDLKKNVCVALCALADEKDIESAALVAGEDPDKWREKSLEERHAILSRVAVNLRRSRGDLIGAAAANTGKVFSEADIEVSEAIDFAEYYPYSVKVISASKNIECKGKGAGLLIAPWNFPIAIPCGGLTAALAAGNTVIFKPASAAIVPAWELCRCFWEAGISKNVLQFVPCRGAGAGARLAARPEIDFIIFTGGTDTALKIFQARPDIYFAAETGGKNATIVTAMADRDQAVKNVIHSAFSNCGQKCSATSLLILEKEVYNDKNFKNQLVDAARSYETGSAWNFKNKMGPMIQAPAGNLKKALTRLNKGEEWALQPESKPDNPLLWSPGIKWGVSPGSDTHMTEFFGPLLGVMCAENLDEAVDIANKTGYGLTSGLESLDSEEQEHWKKSIKAGNLYINRGTTGAVVLRQPFGGMGKSSLGAGIQAGGPNYVAQFMDIKDLGAPLTGAVKGEHPLMHLTDFLRRKPAQGALQNHKADLCKLSSAVKSYLYAKENEFSVKKDYVHLRGQDNLFGYIPAGRIVVRLHADDTLFEILARIAAVKISGCGLIISILKDLKNETLDFLFSRYGERFSAGAEILYQSDNDLIKMMPGVAGIRYAAPGRAPDDLLKAAALRGFYISTPNVVMEGRIELLQYHLEQSICCNYHRYGNLGDRRRTE